MSKTQTCCHGINEFNSFYQTMEIGENHIVDAWTIFVYIRCLSFDYACPLSIS